MHNDIVYFAGLATLGAIISAIGFVGAMMERRKEKQNKGNVNEYRSHCESSSRSSEEKLAEDCGEH